MLLNIDMYKIESLPYLMYIKLWALFRLLPPASLLVGHDGQNAIVMGGFE